MSHCFTMTDIACEIGISMMTTSRTINNEGNSNAIRICIQKIIDRLDDRPSDIAHSLLGLNTNTKSILCNVEKDLPETHYMNPALAALFCRECCMAVQRVEGWSHLSPYSLQAAQKVDYDPSQMAFTRRPLLWP